MKKFNKDFKGDNKGDNVSVVCSDGDMTIDNSPNARYIISRKYYENKWFNCYKEDFINELANEENHSITAEAVANWCNYCHTFHDDSAFVYDSEELEICATLDEAREKVRTKYKPETSIYICENSDKIQFEVTSVSIVAFEPIEPSEKLEASPEIWKKIYCEALEEYWSGFEFSAEKWQALTEKINQKEQALNTLEKIKKIYENEGGALLKYDYLYDFLDLVDEQIHEIEKL